MFDDFLHQLVSGSIPSLRRLGSSMLESTGCDGRGVKQRIPEMKHMVVFNCTSTRLVSAEHDQAGAQYSAAEQQSARADDRNCSVECTQLWWTI